MHVAKGSRPMQKRWWIPLAATCCAAVAGACEPARIVEPGGDDPGAGGSAGSAGSSGSAGTGAAGPELIRNRALCKPGAVDVGPAPTRRISRLEYNNMVRDLFGTTA